MGKYRIGARVRDYEDDEGVIIDKRKGERLVRYDDPRIPELWWSKGSIHPIPLKLEIGKTYVDRDGEAHGPLVKNTIGYYQDSHPFACGSLTWTPTGKFLPLDEGEDGWDLVAEVIDAPATADEPVEERPTFAVGQRVLAKGRGWGETSDLGTIIEVQGFGYYVEFDDGWTDGHDGGKGDDSKSRWYFDGSDLTPFTLEAGKFYRTRDGKKVQIAVTDDYLSADGWHYAEDGICCYLGRHGDTPNTNRDIVAEWVEPEAEPVVAVEKKPTVAIRSGFSYVARDGEVWTEPRAEEEDGDGDWTLKDEQGVRYSFMADGSFWGGDDACRCDLVEEIASQPKFKVGDIVNWTTHRDSWQGIEVIAVNDDSVWPIRARCPLRGEGVFSADQLELAPTPAIGDEVTVTGKLVALDRDGDGEVHFNSLGYTLFFPTSALRAA